MIDLHCHLLPGIDDGAKSLEISLEMARRAVDDGISVVACTPHIQPGVFDNTGPAIRAAVDRLREALAEAGIPLRLVTGADVHIAPDLAEGIEEGRVLTLNDTRYFLLEPPHHVAPPRLEAFAFRWRSAGYVPVITHPERLSWIEGHYDTMRRLVERGVLMQITAGSITGRFGRRAQQWAERMIDDGLCHILATDAHDTGRRAPRLAEARDAVALRVGDEEAHNLVSARPQGILDGLSASSLPAPSTATSSKRAPAPRSVWRRLWTRGRA